MFDVSVAGGLWRAACVLGCLVLFGGAAQGQTPQPRLGAGDVVYLQTRGYKDLTGTFVLNERGCVRFRIAGEIKLSGQTLEQARQTLTTKLSVHFRKLQSLRIRLKAKKKYVWVRGWVRRPGRLHLRFVEGLEVALQKAGGFRKGASTKEVWYYRKGKPPFRVNMLRYYLSKGQMKLPSVGRNTTIFVAVHRSQGARLVGMAPSAQHGAPFVAVFGAVRRPGLYPCLRKIRPLEALVLAGGPLRKAGLQEVLILQGGKTRWFDLRRWMKLRNKAKQPLMSAGAILYVPHRPLGLSGRGSIQLFGAVQRPGVLRTPTARSLPQLLASRGGARSDANLSSIVVTTKGRNFTIKQTVNLPRTMKRGRLELLPPVGTHRPTLVFVPPKKSPSRDLIDAQNITQIVVAAASVVTSVVLIVVTVNAVQTP